MSPDYTDVTPAVSSSSATRRAAYIMILCVACAPLRACSPTKHSDDRAIPVWTLELDLRIDGYDYDLVPIEDLSVSERGVVAITQAQDRTVRLFHETGDDAGTFGGVGAGPGEFGHPGRLGWIGDTLWVSDSQLRRITLATEGPVLLRTMVPPQLSAPVDGITTTSPVVLYSDGSILSRRLGFISEWSSRWTTPAPLPAVLSPLEGSRYLKVRADGTLEGIIARTWPTRSHWSVQLSDGRSAGGHYPFANQAHVGLTDRGDLVAVAFADLDGADAGTYRVVMLHATGDTVYDYRLPFEPQAIPRAVMDSAIAASTDYWRRISPDIAAAYRRGLYVAPVYPPITALVVGYDGSLWIRFRDADASRPYLILDEFGGPAGCVLVPTNLEIRRADKDFVWALEKDDLGVESVLRLRIRKDADWTDGSLVANCDG